MAVVVLHCTRSGGGCRRGVPPGSEGAVGVPGLWVLMGCPQARQMLMGCPWAVLVLPEHPWTMSVPPECPWATSVLLGCPWALSVTLGCPRARLAGHPRAVGATGASQSCGLGHRCDDVPCHSIMEEGSVLPWQPGASQGSQTWPSAGVMTWLCMLLWGKPLIPHAPKAVGSTRGTAVAEGSWVEAHLGACEV